jgi:hypothetical protein
MPLYWSTDQIIAGKYRLKKPIPLKAEFESCEGWWMDFPVSDINNGFRETEEGNIKLVEKHIEELGEYLEEI